MNRLMHIAGTSLTFASLTFLTAAGCDKSGAPTWGTHPTPPAGATFLDADNSAEGVIAEVTSHRGEEAQRTAAAAYAGKWIAEPGWRGAIEKIHEGDGKTVFWMRYTTSANPLTGSFYTALEVPVNDRQPQKAHEITFTGRIEEVRIITAGPAPEYQIIVKDGKVLTGGSK
ncbi:MAG TPA: hypothetical protein VK157_16800 [Phycisphaerales bacterium]|nr:hypothetical protein [Phycisphaerales bacterium]